MGWFQNYLDNVSKSNREFYEEFAQEVVNSEFDDTTLVRTIKEEKYPFNEEYEDYEVQVDSVAEITVNIIKVIGDFISVLFKDCSHKNLRGQKYIYDNETYLCYDKISELSRVARTRLIRCNNEIVWLDENANILREKVFLGYELSSTNDSIGKDGIVSNRRLVLYVQNNEKTKNIKINQRFMFQHNQCFRVEEVDNYNRESGTEDDVTLMRLYLVYSTLLPKDNIELNICDYYDLQFKVEINQESITQTKDFNGRFDAVLKNGEDVIKDAEFLWETEDASVVEIDDDGSYRIVGDIGQSTVINCYMKENETIKDSVIIEVVEDFLPERKIIIFPVITELKEKDYVDFNCKVYIEGEEQQQIVKCVPNWTNDNNFTLIETIDGYKLTNNKLSRKTLQLTFSSENCEDVIMDVKLNGLL